MDETGSGRAQRGRWRRFGRPGVQAAVLVLFVWLALAPAVGWPLPLPSDLFFRFDPLVWVVSSLAGRGLAPWGLLALALVAATAVFGRVFCGWVCPLGAGMDALGRLRRRRPAAGWVARLVVGGAFLPRLVLLALLGAAGAGANFAGWFDPLAMAGRALWAGRLWPAGYSWPAVALGGALVVVALGLALAGPRFWCRVLCPLGALLSLAARAAPWRRRVAATCTRCGACSNACPMGRSGSDVTASDCLVCGWCQEACPEEAVSFGLRAAGAPASPGRGPTRRAFAVAGLAAVGLGAVAGVRARGRSGRAPLRPPGVAGERALAARCVGCGSCLAACPTGGLLPLVSVVRPDALFTPVLVPRVGGCLPWCVACGAACPTGAIARIAAEDKAGVRIGLAVINRSLCLPWAKGERCFVCEDTCPHDYGAIQMRLAPSGLLVPHVREDRCTGCGLCEHRCPAGGAIHVLSEARW